MLIVPNCRVIYADVNDNNKRMTGNDLKIYYFESYINFLPVSDAYPFFKYHLYIDLLCFLACILEASQDYTFQKTDVQTIIRFKKIEYK